jgi:hypothetical protein
VAAEQWPQRPRPERTLVANRTRGYRRPAVRIGISARSVQLASAAAAVVLAILMAAQSAWPFDASRPRLPLRPSLWQLLLSDHVTLGFVRLAIVMVAAFVIASVPALVVGGRWLKGFGAGGFVADDAADLRDELNKMKRELDEVTRKLKDAREERDEAIAVSRQLRRRP